MRATMIILALFGIPAATIAGVAWRGYVLSILWGWFIAPTFGLPMLSVPLAIGVSLPVAMLTIHTTGREMEDKDKGPGITWVLIFLMPAIFLLSGWIVKQFL